MAQSAFNGDSFLGVFGVGGCCLFYPLCDSYLLLECINQ